MQLVAPRAVRIADAISQQAFITSFYRTFKTLTGMSPREWLSKANNRPEIHPHRKNTISLFLLALEGLNLHTQLGWHDGIEEDTHDGSDGKT